jgi:hypothetical protein
MTLRQTLEEEAPPVHEQVDAMLESEDSIIILVDARRAINYARGFGLSACQLEMLANDIERLVRTVTRAHISRKDRKQREQGNGMAGGAGQRHASPDRGRCRCMADERSASGRSRDHGSGCHGFRTGRVLRMASEFAAPDAG